MKQVDPTQMAEPIKVIDQNGSDHFDPLLFDPLLVSLVWPYAGREKKWALN